MLDKVNDSKIEDQVQRYETKYQIIVHWFEGSVNSTTWFLFHHSQLRSSTVFQEFVKIDNSVIDGLANLAIAL